MKRFAVCAALFGLSFAVTAQEPVSPPAVAAHEQGTVAPETSLQRADRDKPASMNRALDRNCLTASASRVSRADGRGRNCGSAPLRVYTREDLAVTGSIHLSDALRRLDPAIY